MAEDEQQKPTETTRPDDLGIDRDAENVRDVYNADSARSIGDILDSRTKSINTEDFEENREKMNTKNLAEAEAEKQAAAARKRRAVGRLGGAIAVALLIYGCSEIVGRDSDTETPPAVDAGSGFTASEDSESGDPEAEDSVVTASTVEGEVPESVEPATPVDGRVTGPNTLVVDFTGNAEAMALGGTLTSFDVSTNISSGTIMVSMHYILENGEPRHGAVKNDMADAVPTEDGQGTVVSGIGGRVEGTFTANNSLTLTVDGFDLPQDGSVEVQVLVQETPGGPLHVLVLR